MQDRYVGRRGRFREVRTPEGDPRNEASRCRFGTLHPNAGPAGDGRHTAYLQHPDEWRHLDAELFDALRKLTADRRSVANIQQSCILGDAAFADDRLVVAGVKARERQRWRHQWFDRIKPSTRRLRSRLRRPRQRPRTGRPLQAWDKGECEADSTR